MRTALACLLIVSSIGATEQKITPAKFAANVAEAIAVIKKSTVAPHDARDIFRTAVEGLYRVRRTTMPVEVAGALRQMQTYDDKRAQIILQMVADGFEGTLNETQDQLLQQLARAVDPRAELQWSPDTFGCFGASFNGIGLTFEPHTDGTVRVWYPYRDGPAYEAGIRSGDVLVGIERRIGNVVKSVSGKALTPTVATEMLEAHEGMQFRLEVRHATTNALTMHTFATRFSSPNELVGVRRDATDRWNYWLDEGAKFAYLREFLHRPDMLTAALADLHKQGLRGLVLDLRGGATRSRLDYALSNAALFVGEAPFCELHSSLHKRAVATNNPAVTYKDVPVVILVDQRTALVAELFAACLQDQHRATIVGERTSGNAANMNHIDILDQSRVLVLPTSVFHRGNGKKLDRMRIPDYPDDEWGVTPTKGYEKRLTATERDALETAFTAQRLLPHRGPKDERPALPIDPQLALALKCLRERVAKP